ncbi:MAG: 3-methyl-2-oxobutanoate hydroxymethyltransferase [Ignavibacteriales bacterium]|nr:3-methyl-2-oxobutanoate hydroxymethyltransferase [Ignavibacteriales bacterium]
MKELPKRSEKLPKQESPLWATSVSTPQSIHVFGSYRERGRDEDEAKEILKDAKILEEAACICFSA